MTKQIDIDSIAPIDLLKIKCFYRTVRLTAVYALITAIVILIGYRESGSIWALISYLYPIGWVYWIIMLREIIIGSQGSWKYYLSWIYVILGSVIPAEMQVEISMLIQSVDSRPLMTTIVILSLTPPLILFYGYRSLLRTTRKNKVPIGILGPKLM